jgi:DNA-binding XRE family transcriptional regulator
MGKAILPFEVRQTIAKLGENLRVARIRRQMTMEEVAVAAQISSKTLYALEKGGPGVSLGVVVSVLWALGLLETMAAVANPDNDEHGRILEAARRPNRVRPATSTDNDF